MSRKAGTSASRKAKGRRACQHLRDLILVNYPELQADDVLVTSSGATGEDLRLSPKARQVLPLAIEVKNQEALNIWAALEQAREHAAGTEHIPALAFKRNNTDMFVTVRADDFFYLLKRDK